jgi:hypothetical protein
MPPKKKRQKHLAAARRAIAGAQRRRRTQTQIDEANAAHFAAFSERQRHEEARRAQIQALSTFETKEDVNKELKHSQ